MLDADSSSYQALEAFVIDNPDLERLETLIAEFNIFEAVGMVRQELRHSDFLGFLLDPNANHGLGDRFLKRFLIRALLDAPVSPPVSPIEIDLLRLDEVVVRREWQHIDLLIEYPGSVKPWVVVIENKVLSGEHDDQLHRYLTIARQAFPRSQIIPVFLTPEGIDATEETYLPMSYGAVADVLETTLDTDASQMGPAVQTLLVHYVTMLRRHIVSDSDIAELCRQIYRRHQRALDLIFEHRPDLQLEISDYMVQLISSAGFVQDRRSKWAVNFCLREWDAIPLLRTGQGWTGSDRMLLFEIKNPKDRLALYLIIGPGDGSARDKLFTLSRTHGKEFSGGRSHQGKNWTTIYKLEILKAQDYEEATFEDLKPKIDRVWTRFVDHDLPPLSQLVIEQLSADPLS